MSQWTDRVSGHAVWTVMPSLGQSIDTALEREGISAEAIDAIERIRTVLTFCGKRLAATEPALILSAHLDGVSTNLNQLKANIEAFTTNGDMAQLTTANSLADKALANLVSILGIATPDDLTAISAAATAYRNTLEKHLKETLAIQQELVTKSKANSDKLAALEIALTAEQQKLSTLITDYQSQFSATQDKRASDFAATQAEFLAKHTAATTEQQTLFSTDQDSRRTAFSEFQSESQKTLTALMSEYTQKLKDHDAVFLEDEVLAEKNHAEQLANLHSKYEVDADKILEDMKRHKSEIESLVGVIGNLGVTSGYKKVADSAKKAVYLWQGATVAALIGLIIVAFMMAFPKANNKAVIIDNVVQQNEAKPGLASQEVSKDAADKKNDDSKAELKPSPSVASTSTFDSDFFHGLATRIFLSITFGIFAAYAGRQASHFLAIEQKNRKLALELEALGPFIEPLEKADRDKFRVQVGDRSFGVPDHSDPKPKEDDPVSVMSLLNSKDFKETITSQIKEAVKSLKPVE